MPGFYQDSLTQRRNMVELYQQDSEFSDLCRKCSIFKVSGLSPVPGHSTGPKKTCRHHLPHGGCSLSLPLPEREHPVWVEVDLAKKRETASPALQFVVISTRSQGNVVFNLERGVFNSWWALYRKRLFCLAASNARPPSLLPVMIFFFQKPFQDSYSWRKTRRWGFSPQPPHWDDFITQ